VRLVPYKEYLLKICREQEAHWQQFLDDETYLLQDVFVPLSVVKSEREDKGLVIESYEALFMLCDGDPEKKCNHLVIEGDAGMGKSTYVCKLAMDWATGKGSEGDYIKNRFSVVVLIRLGEVAEGKSFDDILKGQLPKHCSMIPILIDSLIGSSQGNKLLLLFDGYDEMKAGVAAEIQKVLEGKEYPGVICLTTTRKSAHIEMKKMNPILLEVRGLSKENVKDYVRNKRKCPQELIDVLLAKDMRDITKIPLLLALFCCFKVADLRNIKNELFDIINFAVKYLFNRASSRVTLKLQSLTELSVRQTFFPYSPCNIRRARRISIKLTPLIVTMLMYNCSNFHGFNLQQYEVMLRQT
jgi:NACHT domain